MNRPDRPDPPDRDIIALVVFDKEWQLTDWAKKRLKRVYCDRRKHTVGIAIRTPHGWWVAWRVPTKTTSDGKPWQYGWADEVTGYTLGTCHCGHPRRVDEQFALLPPVSVF